MKIDIISPILLSHAIEYLHHRPIGTKYHIEKFSYLVDGKTFARIIRHNADMKAVVHKKEISFFNAVLQFAVNEKTMKLPRGFGKYFFIEDNTKKGYRVIISKGHKKINKNGQHINIKKMEAEKNANRI